MSEAPRIGVFLSGSGRTLDNLRATIDAGTLDAEIAVVVASRPCLGLEKARTWGIESLVIEGAIPAALVDVLAAEHDLSLIVLAGYLQKTGVPTSMSGRILNIHPALLPGDGTPGRFGGLGMYGDRVHQAVLSSGETLSGCSVHLVSDEYDAGEVLGREEVPVLQDDTVQSLADRVFDAECRLYPRVISERLAALRAASRG